MRLILLSAHDEILDLFFTSSVRDGHRYRVTSVRTFERRQGHRPGRIAASYVCQVEITQR